LTRLDRQQNRKSSAKVAARENGTCSAQPNQDNRKNSDWFHPVPEKFDLISKVLPDGFRRMAVGELSLIAQ
jgi:hypothetical protein